MLSKVYKGEYVTLFIDMKKLILNTWKIMIKIILRHKKFIWLGNIAKASSK